MLFHPQCRKGQQNYGWKSMTKKPIASALNGVIEAFIRWCRVATLAVWVAGRFNFPSRNWELGKAFIDLFAKGRAPLNSCAFIQVNLLPRRTAVLTNLSLCRVVLLIVSWFVGFSAVLSTFSTCYCPITTAVVFLMHNFMTHILSSNQYASFCHLVMYHSNSWPF